MLDYFEIGQRIRTFRKKAGLSQEFLAEKAGISVTHMSHIETGNTKVSLAVLVDISEVLDVTIDSILFDRKNAKPNSIHNEIIYLMSSCSQEQSEIILETVQCLKRALDSKYPK